MIECEKQLKLLTKEKIQQDPVLKTLIDTVQKHQNSIKHTIYPRLTRLKENYLASKIKAGQYAYFCSSQATDPFIEQYLLQSAKSSLIFYARVPKPPRSPTSPSQETLATIEIGQQALDLLAICNQRLVIGEVKQMNIKHLALIIHRLDIEDIISEGNIGLLEAAARFNPSTARFQTYARPLIRGRIIDFFRSTSFVPRHLVRKLDTIHSIEDNYYQQYWAAASLDQLSKATLLSPESIKQILLAKQPPISLNKINTQDSDEDGNQLTFVDQLGHIDPNFHLIEDAQVRTQLLAAITDYLNNQPQRIKTMIMLYYVKGQTFKQIAQQLLISESRVSQLHSRTLTGLKNSLSHLNPFH